MRRRYEKRSHPPGVRASFSVLLYPLRLLLSIIWPALFVGLFGQRGEHLKPGQYHLVVHIWIIDGQGRLLIQKRAAHLKLMPDIWAATGGSAVAGENSHTAAARELREELGIETAGEDLRFAGRIRRRNSFTDIWVLRRDVELSSLRLQTEEVAQAKWVTRTELMDMVARRTFHHYGRPYFELVLQALYPGEG